MARLISFAAGDERIASIMRKSSEQIVTSRRTVNVHSTNKLLLGGDIDVRGGKTGFIRKSGYCLATLLQVPQRRSRRGRRARRALERRPFPRGQAPLQLDERADAHSAVPRRRRATQAAPQPQPE